MRKEALKLSRKVTNFKKGKVEFVKNKRVEVFK